MLRYQIAASIVRSDQQSASLRGALYLNEGEAFRVGGEADPIRLGIRGFSASGQTLLEDRAQFDCDLIQPRTSVSFSFTLPTVTLVSCTRVEIHLVHEGSHWVRGPELETLFTIRDGYPAGTPLLSPSRDFAPDFFCDHENGRAFFALFYLQRLHDVFGEDVMSDFAWRFFLGREPDLKGRNDGLASIRAGVCSIAGFGLGLYESPECRHRIAIRPLADPYRELGIWAEGR